MERTPVHLRLLGGFDLQADGGREIASLGKKVSALMAILAMPPGRSWPREKLMALLWSDRGEEQARASLRQALAELRRSLGEPSPLRTDHDAASLDPAMVGVDIIAFEELAKAERLEQAAALYRGPLLDGHGVRDDAFEDWLRVERARLHELAITVLDRHAKSQTGYAAIGTAQRLLQLDPLREATHRLLMRLYAAMGQRSQALRQYQQCRDALQRELQASPDAETERVHRQIQDDAVPISSSESGGKIPDVVRPPEGKPSIAILRFTNLSDDPDQQYFSYGITEDIVTELSRYRSLFVIARPVDLDAVRQKLAVRYIVEGSVRRSGNRLRVTAQLIDATTEARIWAERYDRDLQDVFAVQDEIARTIATTMEGRVAASGIERAKRKPTVELAAYDCFLRGREREAYFDLAGAETFYARAAELDPGYVQAHACRAIALTVLYWLDQDPEHLRKAEACARTALALDDHDGTSHEAMGYLSVHQRKFELAGTHLNRAVSLNPNDVSIVGDRANWLTRTGRAAEALQSLEETMRRDPFSPTWIWDFYFAALFQLKRYDEAIAALRNMSTLHPWHHAHLAAAYAHAGKLDEARRELATFLKAKPNATIALVAAAEPYAEPRLLEPLLDGLRKAGLKE
jgi:TolB-like protein/DNA-binding SARP family transcriptional activator